MGWFAAQACSSCLKLMAKLFELVPWFQAKHSFVEAGAVVFRGGANTSFGQGAIAGAYRVGCLECHLGCPGKGRLVSDEP